MAKVKKAPATAGHRKHQTTTEGIDVAGGKFYANIPENLNLEDLLDKELPEFPYKLDKFYYIINLMYQIPAQDKRCLLRNQFVPLYSPLIKKMVHNYNDYIEYLLKHEILETNGKYSPGRKSKGYKLTAGYRTARTLRVEFTDHTLIKKLIETRVIRNDATKYYYLYRHFEGITIRSEAYEYIAAKELRRSKKIALEKLKLERITSGTFWFFTDDTGKRLHTPLTSLSSDMRKFITYKGQALVSVDIKCSQPYFLIDLILDYYNVPDQERKNLNLFLSPIPFPPYITSPLSHICSSPLCFRFCQIYLMMLLISLPKSCRVIFMITYKRS